MTIAFCLAENFEKLDIVVSEISVKDVIDAVGNLWVGHQIIVFDENDVIDMQSFKGNGSLFLLLVGNKSTFAVYDIKNHYRIKKVILLLYK